MWLELVSEHFTSFLYWLIFSQIKHKEHFQFEFKIVYLIQTEKMVHILEVEKYNT